MNYLDFRRDGKLHVLTFSTSGQRQVTTCCTCAVTSPKKYHVSGCRRQAGDVCCLRCLLAPRKLRTRLDCINKYGFIIFRLEVIGKPDTKLFVNITIFDNLQQRRQSEIKHFKQQTSPARQRQPET